MGIISWVVFGLVIGAIARFLLPGQQKMSWIMTILLGIAGSFAGGALSSLFTDASLVNPAGSIMSIVGAVLVLLIYSRVASRR